MRKIIIASKPFVFSIIHDFMMLVCILVPIIMGVAFRFILPYVERLLCQYFLVNQIMEPFYIIFDLMLAIMTPIMFCFSGVLVMLEEFDSGTAKYYFVTPVGKRGYLQSRLVLPATLALFYDIVLLAIFNVSEIDAITIVVFSVCGIMMAIICALLVVGYANNKIEGMAFIKLCGILLVGIPVVYFVNSPMQYLFSVFPSFWLAKISRTGNYIFAIPTTVTSGIMIIGLYYKFVRKKIS